MLYAMNGDFQTFSLLSFTASYWKESRPAIKGEELHTIAKPGFRLRHAWRVELEDLEGPCG